MVLFLFQIWNKLNFKLYTVANLVHISSIFVKNRFAFYFTSLNLFVHLRFFDILNNIYLRYFKCSILLYIFCSFRLRCFKEFICGTMWMSKEPSDFRVAWLHVETHISRLLKTGLYQTGLAQRHLRPCCQHKMPRVTWNEF